MKQLESCKKFLTVKMITHQCRIKFLKWLKKNQGLIPKVRLGWENTAEKGVEESISSRIAVSEAKIENLKDCIASVAERHADYVYNYQSNFIKSGSDEFVMALHKSSTKAQHLDLDRKYPKKTTGKASKRNALKHFPTLIQERRQAAAIDAKLRWQRTLERTKKTLLRDIGDEDTVQ